MLLITVAVGTYLASGYAAKNSVPPVVTFNTPVDKVYDSIDMEQLDLIMNSTDIESTIDINRTQELMYAYQEDELEFDSEFEYIKFAYFLFRHYTLLDVFELGLEAYYNAPYIVEGRISRVEQHPLSDYTKLTLKDRHGYMHEIDTLTDESEFKVNEKLLVYGNITSIIGENKKDIRGFTSPSDTGVGIRSIIERKLTVQENYVMSEEEKELYFANYHSHMKMVEWDKELKKYVPFVGIFESKITEKSIDNLDITIYNTSKIGDDIYISFRYNDTRYHKDVVDYLIFKPDSSVIYLTHYSNTNRGLLRETPTPTLRLGFNAALWYR